MGRLDYSAITRHRWAWPLIDLAAILLWTTRDLALRHEQRNAARCHGNHCAHH